MKRKSHLCLPWMMAGCLASVSANGAIISHDSFSGYTAGELPANPSPAVTGYTGDWTDVDFGDAEPSITPGSLVYADPLYLGSSGDRVTVATNTVGGEINAANSGRVFRLLSPALSVTGATSGTIYLSLLFRSGQENGSTVYQMLSLYDGNTADGNRNFDIGLTSNGGQTGNAYNFGADNDYASTGVAATSTVHLFVVRFDLSSAALGDSVTVWVDPVLGAGTPAGGTTVGGKDLTWDRLAFSDYDGNSAEWDELRWGTDFNAVTIPEPGSFLLGALGSLQLLRRRRN